jgi:sulfiredoxin
MPEAGRIEQKERPEMATIPGLSRLDEEQWGCSIGPSLETIDGFEHLAAAQGPYRSRAFNALTCLRQSTHPRPPLSKAHSYASRITAHKLPPRRHYAGVVGMVLKRQMLAIQDVYVPVKRRQTLDPQKVEALAESMIEKGQQAPILVRPDGHRFVLVEGLHRLEACKALGETTVPAYLVQARQH